MTEDQSTAISKPRAINKRAIFDIVCGVLVLAMCAWGFWKGPIWPDRIGILVGVVPPLLLILQRAQNRQFHPDRLPVRWSASSRSEVRLTTLTGVLTAIFFLFMFPWVVVDTSKHPGSDHPYFLIALTAQTWAQFLDQYIADRKYIPPEEPPYDPSKTWTSGMKRFQSERWGEQA